MTGECTVLKVLDIILIELYVYLFDELSECGCRRIRAIPSLSLLIQYARPLSTTITTTFIHSIGEIHLTG
jgi:hypothetical protein